LSSNNRSVAMPILAESFAASHPINSPWSVGTVATYSEDRKDLVAGHPERRETIDAR